MPQILEQSSAMKDVNVNLDMLKRIISTSEQNSKVIAEFETSNKLPDGEMGELIREIRLLAIQLLTRWEAMPVFDRIPKKERIEQMKEHEREADENCKNNDSDAQQKPPSMFSSSGRFVERTGKPSEVIDPREKDAREKDPRFRRYTSAISKHQRRQLFAAKVIFVANDKICLSFVCA